MILRKLRRSQGQSSVEFSLTLVAFIVMIFAVGDMMQVAYNWMGIQYASNRGIRRVKLLPTYMDSTMKSTKVREEVIRAAQVLGISLTNSEVTANVGGGSVTVETLHPINLSPVSGMILGIGGDHSGVYNLRVREAVRNDSL